MRSRPVAAVAAAVVAAGCLSGCGTAPEPGLAVFAASSLTAAFTALGDRFHDENPDIAVEFTFAGSADLLAQLTGGARVDVFAAADGSTMDRAVAAGLVEGAPVNFASNTLTVVVAPGNPERLESFADLARPGLAVVTCAPQVPCGAATRKAERAAGVTLDPASEETNVAGVLAKVTGGQADAGVVYVTDALAAGDAVTAVAIPEAAGVVNTYPIAVLRGAADPQAAHRFVGLVTAGPGRAILAGAGFARP